MTLWPYIVLRVCLSLSPGVCEDVYLPVNIEDRGLLGPAAAEITCKMTFFRTAVVWEQSHPGWRVQESACEYLDPDAIAKGT